MLHTALPFPPSASFWPELAHALVCQGWLARLGMQSHDCSAVRVIVPGFVHAQQLKAALAHEFGCAFIPPRITTLSAWLCALPPVPDAAPVSHSERMMSLYAELREHGWLKKLFTARRNTDLLPLARTLLTLFDELTTALLPSMQVAPDEVEARWQTALQQLAGPARGMLSDEAQLVWSLWKAQLDRRDASALRFSAMMGLADRAPDPLIWIGAGSPDALEQAFLDAYSRRQPVLPVMLDWRRGAVAPVYAAAWQELCEPPEADAGALQPVFPGAAPAAETPAGVAVCTSGSLEEEALRGAQTIIEWLQAGRSRIAIVAQDRAVARRIRALLERAQIFVADETGWRLSTTRSAAAVAALLDAAATRAETVTLLDLLKSPFLFPELDDREDCVMAIDAALRRANVLAGWEASIAALAEHGPARRMLNRIAEQAGLFAGRKTLCEWVSVTDGALSALGMREALEMDAAGAQVIALLDQLARDCESMPHAFSFAEWRAFLNLQLEATSFMPADFDRRVVMLQLNGARLRSFDAVLVVGADAEHLPSRSAETLFFANAVRRELGLQTKEAQHRVQLRDLAELLQSNPDVVLSWQTCRNGEPNPASPWVERLQLALERSGAARIPPHPVCIQPVALRRMAVARPAPSAAQLVPSRLSATAYNSLVACPYQFFATRMLGLSGMDELSDMPEKRDYGDWLHRILKTYHERVRDEGVGPDRRLALLQEISDQVFDAELAKSAAALGYHSRWRKAMPAYVAWANDRESSGWQFADGERECEVTLRWENGEITLYGRIDRIDRHESGAHAVLDYKAKNLQSLRDRLKEGEDHQLAFYGMLSGLGVSAGHYVALDAARDKTGDAPAPNYEQWQEALQTRLTATMQALSQGAVLQASGIEKICVYCEVRGLCRKGAW